MGEGDHEKVRPSTTAGVTDRAWEHGAIPVLGASGLWVRLSQEKAGRRGPCPLPAAPHRGRPSPDARECCPSHRYVPIRRAPSGATPERGGAPGLRQADRGTVIRTAGHQIRSGTALGPPRERSSGRSPPRRPPLPCPGTGPAGRGRLLLRPGHVVPSVDAQYASAVGVLVAELPVADARSARSRTSGTPATAPSARPRLRSPPSPPCPDTACSRTPRAAPAGARLPAEPRLAFPRCPAISARGAVGPAWAP